MLRTEILEEWVDCRGVSTVPCLRVLVNLTGSNHTALLHLDEELVLHALEVQIQGTEIHILELNTRTRTHTHSLWWRNSVQIRETRAHCWKPEKGSDIRVLGCSRAFPSSASTSLNVGWTELNSKTKWKR